MQQQTNRQMNEWMNEWMISCANDDIPAAVTTRSRDHPIFISPALISSVRHFKKIQYLHIFSKTYLCIYLYIFFLYSLKKYIYIRLRVSVWNPPRARRAAQQSRPSPVFCFTSTFALMTTANMSPSPQVSVLARDTRYCAHDTFQSILQFDIVANFCYSFLITTTPATIE